MTRTVVRTKVVQFRVVDGCSESEAYARQFYFNKPDGWSVDAQSAADVIMTARKAREDIEAGRYTVTRRRGYWVARIETAVP